MEATKQNLLKEVIDIRASNHEEHGIVCAIISKYGVASFKETVNFFKTKPFEYIYYAPHHNFFVGNSSKTPTITSKEFIKKYGTLSLSDFYIKG